MDAAMQSQQPGIAVPPKPAVLTAHAKPASPPRLTSLDVYRGFVMMLMASDGLHLAQVARAATLRDSSLWQFLAYQTDHVAWSGCALWDLIQPSFTFMVGVSMPYSLSSRKAKGDSFNSMLLHALIRSFILVTLGVLLRSVGRKMTYFTFEDTLSQIGLGYTFLFLIAWLKPKAQFATMCGILLAYWAAFALYPLPPADFDYTSVGVPKDWAHHLTGFAQHWDKNTNISAYVDRTILNWFPREKPFVFNGGGYLTLSFIPTFATMILGLLAGEMLRTDWEMAKKFKTLVIAGVSCLALAFVLDQTGIAPSVKRIWTPGWVIFSGGWCCLLLATFYGIVDIKGKQAWAFPLLVVGMNSIAMYCMAELWPSFIRTFFKTHFNKTALLSPVYKWFPTLPGENIYDLFGIYAPIVEASSVLLVLWLICYWMYQRKLFLRI